jgi:hypothetical protein
MSPVGFEPTISAGERPQIYALRLVHTCYVTAYRNAVTLQVTDTIRSYELKFHPVPHGVTVSCESYTRRFPVCYGSQSDVFVASSDFVHLYTLRAAVVTKATVHNQGSVQRFSFAGRLEFSIGQWFIQGFHQNVFQGI